MSLRRRLALLSATAVAVTVVLASAITYVLVRDSLRGDIDDDLRRQAERGAERLGREGPPGPRAGLGGEPGEFGGAPELPPPGPGGPIPIGALITPDGEVVSTPGSPIEVPVSEGDVVLARSGGEPRFGDAEAEGTSLRTLTTPLREGGALVVAASLADTEDTLATLVLVLVLVSAGGVALAAALGPVVARTALAPAGEVSDAAQEVARTQDLTRRIEVRGDDELGRLAASFNEMMAALERSEASQRRLVADASHELRTPLAVLRTNIETLGRADEMRAAERDRLVADVTEELEELTALVADVVELAREPGAETLVTRELALDELAGDAVARARRRFRGLRFDERLSPGLVEGDPQRLGRAISNLIDNAAKWSPEGGEVEVALRFESGRARLAVRDHGPGFPADELDRVFDRFWRADEARGTHGSGLGLAIVARVADEHGGRAEAANAEGGGAVVAIELPAAENAEAQAPS